MPIKWSWSAALGLLLVAGLVIGIARARRVPSGEAATRTRPKQDEYHRMIRIPAGPFLMGRENRPATLTAYEIDKYEALQSDYLHCVDARACTLPGHSFPGQRMPVGGVTWKQADTFCRWAGKRLPTTEEWEKAARGPDGGHAYPWGDEWRPTYANWCDSRDWNPSIPLAENERQCDGSIDGYAEAAPIDAFPQGASPYGVQQMAGNQLEWTAAKVAGGNGGEDFYRVRGGAWWGPKGLGSPNLGLLTWSDMSDPAAVRPPHLGVRCAR